MDIRVLNDNERSQAAALWLYCFGDTREFVDWYFSRRAGEVLGMMNGDELAAQIVCAPLTLDLRGAPRDAMMLSGVATAPSGRGRGYMSKLMRAGLAYLRERGTAAAALYPYEYGFYEQYGFAKCGEVAKVTAPLSRMTAAKLTGDVVVLNGGEGDFAALARAYEASYSRYSGRVLRDEAYFAMLMEELAQDGGYGAVYRRGGEEKGYMLYVMSGETMTVNEIGAADHIARQDMYGFICGHSSTMQTVEFLCPLEDPLWRLISDPRDLVSAQPYAMLRIVDIEKAMNGLPAGEGEATLKVTDPYAPWNEGFWRFSAEGGALAAEKVPGPGDGRAPEISVGALSQWAFGSADGSDLQSRGALPSDGCAEALDGLLPRRPVFLYEKY